MPANPKIKREEDKDYKKYVASQPCVVGHGCIGDRICHHSRTKGSGGSDYSGVCLCMAHHNIVHQIGSETFQDMFNIDFQTEIVKLLTGYIRMLKNEHGNNKKR